MVTRSLSSTSSDPRSTPHPLTTRLERRSRRRRSLPGPEAGPPISERLAPVTPFDEGAIPAGQPDASPFDSMACSDAPRGVPGSIGPTEVRGELASIRSAILDPLQETSILAASRPQLGEAAQRRRWDLAHPIECPLLTSSPTLEHIAGWEGPMTADPWVPATSKPITAISK
jgi:hypothetical protein